jgi:hypothetical protein
VEKYPVLWRLLLAFLDIFKCMSEELKINKSTTDSDFYKALERMLRAQDALADERFSIDEYPHNDFAKFFVISIKELKKSDLLKPISFMHIPFKMGFGTRKTVDASVKEKYKKYIDQLMKVHTPKELSSKELLNDKLKKMEKNQAKKEQDESSEFKEIESIHNHLELWSKLEGTRVFDFDYEHKNKYPGWNGWLPEQWGINNPDFVKEFEHIGKEFNFSHSIALLYQLCDAQKGDCPVKEKWVLYYWGIKNAEELYHPDSNNSEWNDLKLLLQNDYPEIIETNNVEDFKQSIKYFNPHDMTVEEMNKFFICSLIKCAENKEEANTPFYKKLCLLGRLNKIHCFPLSYLEPVDSKLPDVVRAKVHALKDCILGKKIIFPAKNKIKAIDADWDKKIQFIMPKIPFKKVMPMFCNLNELKKKIEECDKTGNQEQLKVNKEIIDNATTIYPILDWVKLSIDDSPDKEHKLLNIILFFFCEYSADPEYFNKKIMAFKTGLIPFLVSAKDDPDKVLERLNKINDGIVPDLLSLVGFAERIFYPYKIGSELNESMAQKVERIVDYLSDESNYSVLAFRSFGFLGNVFKHPKITKIITLPDFERNLVWVKELKNILPLVMASIFPNEQQKEPKVLNEKIASLLQPGKIDFENHFPQ